MTSRYFDAGAFTPLHETSFAAVQEVLQKQVKGQVGNPLSSHAHGREASKYVEQSQEMIARVYQMRTRDIVFTSGATEANLLAVRTALLHAKRSGRSLEAMHVVIGFDEHNSLFRILEYIRTLGVRGTVIQPSQKRRFTPQEVANAVCEDTVCVSLQLVNSLHGLVQPVAHIADACRAVQPNLFFHTDSAQGTAYYNCSPHSLRVDAATIDGTKTFGPQGVGALLFQKVHRYTGLQGEHSTFDLRPGTPSVALLYGFAVAVRLMHEERTSVIQQVASLRQYLFEQLVDHIPVFSVRGLEKEASAIRSSDWDLLAPHLLYVSFPQVNHAYLATLLDTRGFSTSTGSACSAQGSEAIRMGLVPTTTKQDIQALVQCIQECLPLARSES